MSAMVELNMDTEARNTHPITLLWVDKICHLSGYKQDYSAKVTDAYRDVSILASQ